MTNGETRFSKPSRFVDELPEGGVEINRKRPRSSGSNYYEQNDFGDFSGGFRKSWTTDFGGSSSGNSFGGYNRGNSDRGGWSGGYGSVQYDREQSVSRHTASIKNDAFKKVSGIEKKEPDYKEGDRVSHVKFGEGTVSKIEEDTKDYKVTVEFDDFGTKVMYAGFAKLEKI